jgi:hypothetical protein
MLFQDMRIKIDGEVHQVESYITKEDGDYLAMVTTNYGEYYLAKDSQEAGEAAKKYWQDQQTFNPAEFVFIVGENNLIQWALGNMAGPGSILVSSLNEWFDLYLDVPEEQWAGYDGEERQVQRVGHLAEELGFVPTVAYRWN